MDGIVEYKTSSYKYTEMKFNIEDVAFSIHYTHRFNTKDGIPVDSQARELSLSENKSGRALHTHRFCEMFFFLKDGLEVFFDDRKILLEENDVLLIFPSVTHTAATAVGKDAFCIDFSYEKNALYRPHGLFDLLNQLSKNGYIYLQGFKKYTELVNIFYKHLDTGNSLMVARYFYDIISDVLMASSNVPHVSPKDMLYDTDISRSRKIDALIGRYYTENLTLGFMAEYLNLSVRQTSRVIRAYTGKTLGELVLARRMRVASDYLAEGKLSISEIASRVGYNSLPCFYLAFKKQFNCLPKDYKNKFKTTT